MLGRENATGVVLYMYDMRRSKYAAGAQASLICKIILGKDTH